ncbi:MAG: aldehyde dehydrogenase family protein, partial [SAR324 cluster bacterium]|nr:aldehyde dehydrogenase family protein [SAR324 cluster bacterium]
MGMKDLSLFCEQAYIAGNWSDADSGKKDEVLNPATGEVLGTVPQCGQQETRKAIEVANQAMPAWKATPAKERGKILRRWYELMIENKEDLAILMTAEQGKPLAESQGEILYASSFFEWFAEEAKRMYGETIPTHMPDRRLLVVKEGVGVTAAITPWNFPAAMITRKA